MPVANPRGAPVIYVAGSARELPADVQDWLSRAETRAVASPHLYDMLAQLARGRKFAAIIVNVQSVDWNEMEFFDHLARLNRSTPVFVTGSHQQRAKLEAACRRGARLFDSATLEEELAQTAEHVCAACAAPQASSQAESPVALRPSQEPAPASESWPRVRLAEPEISGPELGESAEAAQAQAEDIESGYLDELAEAELPKTADVRDTGPDPIAHPAPVVPPDPQLLSIADEPELPDPQAELLADPTALIDGLHPPIVPETPSADVVQTDPVAIEVAPSPADPDPQEDDRPAVRLAATNEEPETEDRPVLFPWSSYPNRPKRTPPTPLAGSQEPKTPPAAQAPETNESPFRSVRLTPEEISALMGQPPRRQAPEGQL